MTSPQNQKLNWVNIIWLVGSPLAAVILVPWHLATFGFSWGWIVLALVLFSMTGLSITAGYHRYLAHRSYEANRFVKLAYLLVGAGAFQGSAMEWATDHRRHHRQVDTDDDPYNIRRGLVWAHIGWLFFRDDKKYAGKFAPDFEGDRYLVWQHRYYVPLAILSGFIVPMFIGIAMGSAMGGLIWGGLVRIVFNQHCTFFINSLCHYVGNQPYFLKNSARDSFVMAILAWGEGYHNFHHRFQTDYRNGFRWYHWDPTKWLIQVLALTGLARRLKVVPDPIILSARMQVDHARLLEKGVPSERLVALKVRVEEAQKRFRAVYDDYKSRKRTMEENSRRRVLQLKAELKVARLEFKMACAQWYAYIRTLKALPAAA